MLLFKSVFWLSKHAPVDDHTPIGMYTAQIGVYRSIYKKQKTKNEDTKVYACVEWSWV